MAAIALASAPHPPHFLPHDEHTRLVGVQRVSNLYSARPSQGPQTPITPFATHSTRSSKAPSKSAWSREKRKQYSGTAYATRKALGQVPGLNVNYWDSKGSGESKVDVKVSVEVGASWYTPPTMSSGLTCSVPKHVYQDRLSAERAERRVEDTGKWYTRRGSNGPVDETKIRHEGTPKPKARPVPRHFADEQGHSNRCEGLPKQDHRHRTPKTRSSSKYENRGPSQPLPRHFSRHTLYKMDRDDYKDINRSDPTKHRVSDEHTKRPKPKPRQDPRHPSESRRVRNEYQPIRTSKPRQKYPAEKQRNRGNHEEIPRHIQEEFHKKWYADDEDNDADQLLADLTPNVHAPWRVHQPLFPDTASNNELEVADMLGAVHQYQERFVHSNGRLPKPVVDRRGVPVSVVGEACKPMRSTFDWDSSDDEDEDNDFCCGLSITKSGKGGSDAGYILSLLSSQSGLSRRSEKSGHSRKSDESDKSRKSEKTDLSFRARWGRRK